MATTLWLCPETAVGILDAAGVALASGIVRMYDPGTTNTQVVYSDSAASSAYTQPITLDSYGKKNIWIKKSARILIKDATDTVTLYDWDPGSQIRAEQVLITNANVNGGTQITLDAALTANAGAFGSYSESSTATARTLTSWMQEEVVSITDYGAVGDGATDDTAAIQAALNRVLAADRTSVGAAKTAVLLIPQGVWKITTAITAAVTTGTKQIVIRGQGPKASVLKQFGTTVNGLYLNYTGSTDVKTIVENLGLTCNSVSTGTGILITNANNVTVRNCESALFKVAFDSSGATGVAFENCAGSTSSNASSACGFALGSSSYLVNCAAVSTGAAGSAITGTGANIEIRGPVISGFANGVVSAATDTHVNGALITAVTDSCKFTGADSTVRDVNFAGTPTRAINLAAAGCSADYNKIAGAATTGITVGAFADCRVTFNRIPTATTKIAIDGSATNTVQFGNTAADSKAMVVPQRFKWFSSRTTVAMGATLTPIYDGGPIIINYNVCGSGGAGTLTVGATATTGLAIDDVMFLCLANDNGSGGDMTISFNAQYVETDGSGSVDLGAPACGVGDADFFMFVWNGSAWVCNFYVRVNV